MRDIIYIIYNVLSSNIKRRNKMPILITLTLDLENLSNEARDLICALHSKDFSPKQIMDVMEDGEYLKKSGISSELAEEIHSFMCDNWKAIQKIGF